MISKPYSPTLHRIALATAIATFPLIFMGGLVTSHGAGMSVPDWPNSYGYNMFTFPPSKWIGGIFYEHTHRLMGTVVGMLSILLCFLAWKVESRRSVRLLSLGVDGMNEDEIARGFADVGAQLSGSFDTDRAGLSMRTLSSREERGRALEIFSRLLQHPVFPENVLEREKARLVAALKEADTKPDTIASREF